MSNEYIGLYFFSALFQGNMALLALVGVFAVFRIEQFTRKKENVDERMFTYLSQRFMIDPPRNRIAEDIVAQTKTTHEVELLLSSNLKAADATLRDTSAAIRNTDAYKVILRSWQVIEEQQQLLIHRGRVPLIWSLIILVYSLVFMILIHPLHSMAWLEISIIIFAVLLQVISFWKNVAFIQMTVSE